MPKARTGLTLLDTILTIGIISLLVSITIPALSRTKLQATNAASLSNMRTHGQTLNLYSFDHQDTLPYLTDPNADLTVLRGGGFSIAIEFFWVTEYWFIGLTDNYYSGTRDRDLFSYPAESIGHIYQYSSTLYTKPEYWKPASRTDHTQWKPVKITQATYPSAKAAFTEFAELPNQSPLPTWSQIPTQGGKYGFGFLDGSARRLSSLRLLPPYPTGDGGGPQTRYGEIGVVGVHTQDGIHGRDVN